MKISHFSKLSNTSTRMLRHYEKIGLLDVTRSSEDNNYREYSAKELQKVAQIKTLQELGFTLATIKEILDDSSPENLTTYFEQQKEALQAALEKVQSQKALLTSISNVLKEDTRYLDYHVILKEIPERQVMSIRRIVPDYTTETTLWQELYAEFLAQEVTFSNPPLGITLYHDEAYEESNLDIEIQSSIVGNYKDTKDVMFKTVPEMTVVSSTFNGDFNQMPLVMEALGQWIEANNYIIAGPMINIFHVSATQDLNPENWITEACLVIKPKEEI